MPRDVDRSYTSLIDGLDAMMRGWGGAHPVG